MNDIEYQATQDKLVLLAQFVKNLDLDNFLNAITNAESLGPILDPTLYHRAADKLENVKRLAQAARTFQYEVFRQLNLPPPPLERSPSGVLA